MLRMSDDAPLPADLTRYARQIRFAPLGEAGQKALAAGRALICGCGALGSVIAESLTRAGVGGIRIVDRDFVEISNLQRQVLYDEQDAAQRLPKAIAAAEKLRRINSQVDIEPIVADVHAGNVLELAAGVQVILDGTDNFETRFLLNDAAIQLGIPWVYGGCLGAEGQSMTILPGETACLRCLMPEPPAPGETPTCDTAGILGPIVNVIASIAAAEGLKILSGRAAAISRVLSVIDLWDNRLLQIRTDGLRSAADCRACCHGELSWLSGRHTAHSTVLCGRNAVQISPPPGGRIALDALAAKLAGVGQVTRNRYLLRLAIDGHELTIFPDGRAIIGGTADPAVARSLYTRYVGL